MKESEKYFRMADWAEKKSNQNSIESKPWSLRNARMYADKMSDFLAKAYQLERQGL